MTTLRADERTPASSAPSRLFAAGLALLLAAAGVVAGPAAAASAAPVSDFAALQAALTAGGTVELANDITGGQQLEVPVNAVLELSGHTLTVTVTGIWDAAIFVHSGATFTVGTSAGTLHAESTGGEGAGIGGRLLADSGNIVINGGTVTARSGYGAGIGAGNEGNGGNIEINGGIVSSTGGTGIGAAQESSAGDITITGGTVTAIGTYYTAIGSGTYSTVGDITISGGHVTATSGADTGIGAGRSATAGDILISGGTVIATGHDTAGIGAGPSFPARASQLGSITISGGSVTASTIYGGPGIGVGNDPMTGIITISGGTVRATGSREGPGIGATGTQNPTIVISGGNVTAIGGGYRPGPSPLDRGGPGIGMSTSVTSPGPIGTVTIGAAATVTVQSGFPTVTSAIGASDASLGLGFPAVTNSGTLIIASGSTLMIPSGSSVANQGAIRGTVDGSVTGNSYRVTFGQPGVPGAVSTVIPVYAETFAASGISIPTPSRVGPAFVEWNSRVTGVGTTLTPTTPLSTSTWSAIWTPVGDPTTTTAAISAPVVAAGSTVTLTATISPAVDGTIAFSNEAGALAGGVVTGGEFSLTVVAPAAGLHTISAVFTPSDTNLYRPSDATPMTLLVNAKKAQGSPPAPDTSELLRLAALNGWTTVASSPSLAWAQPTDSFVDAWVYSSPVALGVLPVVGGRVDASALTLPTLAPGLHHLVFVGQTTGAVTIVPFTVAAAPTAPTLPATGTDVAPWGILAGVLLLAGVAMIVRQRGLRTI
ncbi:beta strand repeat-containing protein [Salinibacterium hongtaonis]|uniref:Bacterial Ig-like domain-containing protein n=1 Tax=Homoserinimonas hongtaonis TaxID=2079791 RepID=A0A2U1T173_9MICO|nr:LPXTG cell wall anchor domain-containing protein [Salinibacterium hongtaonis]PWB97616.1 hypothetical protein DF220_07065 [Salinibacterium hongtaonis]